MLRPALPWAAAAADCSAGPAPGLAMSCSSSWLQCGACARSSDELHQPLTAVRGLRPALPWVASAADGSAGPAPSLAMSCIGRWLQCGACAHELGDDPTTFHSRKHACNISPRIYLLRSWSRALLHTYSVLSVSVLPEYIIPVPYLRCIICKRNARACYRLKSYI